MASPIRRCAVTCWSRLRMMPVARTTSPSASSTFRIWPRTYKKRASHQSRHSTQNSLNSRIKILVSAASALSALIVVVLLLHRFVGGQLPVDAGRRHDEVVPMRKLGDVGDVACHAFHVGDFGKNPSAVAAVRSHVKAA